jgi:hypothetical protein
MVAVVGATYRRRTHKVKARAKGRAEEKAEERAEGMGRVVAVRTTVQRRRRRLHTDTHPLASRMQCASSCSSS